MKHLTLKAAALAVVMSAGAAQATSIVVTAEPGIGAPIALNPGDFSETGTCGYGESVINDGCSVALKSDPDAPDAFGRFDPWGGQWIDSQDLAEVTWTLSPGRTFNRLIFALTDAYDQPYNEDLGESFFTLSVDGADWSIDQQEANGTLHWITVLFGEDRTEAEIHFSTRLNDGWGIRAAMVAPVPLPATGLLMVAGLGGLATVRRRRCAAK